MSSDLTPLLGRLLALAPVGALVRTFGTDTIVYWSHGAEELYGWSASEAIGRVGHNLLRTRFPISKEAVDAALLASGHWVGELVHTRRDGEQVVVASHQAVQRDEHGRPLATLEINVDLTNRRQMERDLHASEERFRLLVESIQDYAIFLVSPDGRVLTWNEGAQRLKGYLPEEIIGQHLARFYTPEDVERGLPQALLSRAASEGRVEHEGWRVRKDGSRFWADVVVTALRDERGNLQGFAKVTRDLTERKQAEEARARASREEGARAAAEAAQAELRASRDQLAAILAGVAEGIVVFDTSGRMLYANSAAARLCGFASAADLMAASQEDILGRFEMLDESGASCRFDRLPAQLALAGQTPAETTVRFRVRATGEERWSLVNATPITDAAGRVTMAVSIFHDVTDRKRAEDTTRFLAAVNLELSRSLEYEPTLRRLAELSVPTLADWCLVDMLDADGRLSNLAIAHADPGRRRLADALSGSFSADLAALAGTRQVVRAGRPRLVATISDARLEAVARDADHLALLRSLQLRSIIVAPLVARGRTLGRIMFVAAESGRRYGPADLAVVEDLVVRASLAVDNARLYREAQEQAATLVGLNVAVHDAMERLRHALETRDEFLASASHDLKNPVASIKAIAQLLQRRLARAGQIQREPLLIDLARIDAVATRASRQIDELLDIARMQMDRPLDLDRRPVDLVALAREVVAEHQQRSRLHRISVEASVPQVIGRWDGRRLARVVGNLLDNAVKYSPDGGAIRVRVTHEDGAPAWAVVSVEDQGVGIPEQELDRIFERFQRGTNVVGHIAGTGIGLASARTIVESHGGTIAATSRPGEGACFTIRLPLADSDE
jgi:PAS domain S-box-containing protein